MIKIKLKINYLLHATAIESEGIIRVVLIAAEQVELALYDNAAHCLLLLGQGRAEFKCGRAMNAGPVQQVLLDRP